MKNLAIACALILTATASWSDEALDRALETTRVSVDFADAPLDVVLDHLRNVTRLTIAVHPEADDHSPHAPRLTLRLENASLKTVLKLALRPGNLEVQAVEGALLVVPRRVVQEQTHLVMYDVRDLLAQKPDFEAPEVALPDADAWNDGVVFVGFESRNNRFLESHERIVDMVRENCGGVTWQTVPTAAIRMSKNGLLWVTQSREVHAEIGKLLDECRRHQ